jgi:hypothetical protein
VRTWIPLAAHPNPVRDRTTISYLLSGGAQVSGCIYDAAGNLVDRLAGSFEVPGRHEMTWEAAGAAPGVYFFKLIAGAEASSVRLIKVN